MIFVLVCISTVTQGGIAFGGEQYGSGLNVSIPFEGSKVDKMNAYPTFRFYDSRLGIQSNGLYSFWNYESCLTKYNCKVQAWGEEKPALVVSNPMTINDTWSWIHGREVSVVPGDNYTLSIRMKINEYAEESHVVWQAYNKSSESWFPLKYCPEELNESMRWESFRCDVVIPYNVEKIVPVLNAGWSSVQGKDSLSWFDDVSITNSGDPWLLDATIKLSSIPANLTHPTSMAFLGPDDILVTEKDSGKVKRVYNGHTIDLLDMNVANIQERGLLGIAIGSTENGTMPKYVFIYVSETRSEDGEDSIDEGTIIGNMLYRFDIVKNPVTNSISLTNRTLLLSLPSSPGPYHNGGPVLIGPDKNIYLATGDLFNNFTQASNVPHSPLPDGRGGILKISQDGIPTGKVLGSTYPLDLYFAYGIRNIFGLDFDPVTGILWDSENGPAYGDELNLVEAGFNSGWKQVQGIWEPSTTKFAGNKNLTDNMTINPNSYLPGNEVLTPLLVDFESKGSYSPPVLTWKNPIGITAIKFLNTTSFGEKYTNDLLVGDSWGRIYHFELTDDRRSVIIPSLENNSVINESDDMRDSIWGQNFGTITDIDIGPDGYLYILSYSNGILYKIAPS